MAQTTLVAALVLLPGSGRTRALWIPYLGTFGWTFVGFRMFAGRSFARAQWIDVLYPPVVFVALLAWTLFLLLTWAGPSE